MQILINEIKKILTLKMIGVLLIVNGMFYFLFIEFYITHFPNGTGLFQLNVSKEILENYGVNMDENEFINFKQSYQVQVKEVERYLQSEKEFLNKNVTTYEKFRQIEGQGGGPLKEVIWKMYDKKIGSTLWKLYESEEITQHYEEGKAAFDAWLPNPTSKQQNRIEKLKADGNLQLYPNIVLDNFKQYIYYTAIVIILSTIIVVSPMFMKDRARNLLEMQYTTKKGRNLYKLKAAAGLVSVFIVITGLLIVYFSLYSLTHTGMFFDIPVHNFYGYPYWYDLTYLQYMILSATAVYILGFISAMIAMSVSSIVPNYITLIGVQIPYLFVLITWGLENLIQNIISISISPWVVPMLYGVMFVVSLAFMYVTWKHERCKDIVL